MTDRASPGPCARIVLSACFLAGGIGIGTWGANLPALGRRAGLDEGEIGLVLLSFAAGAILAMTNAPRMISRLGAERMAVISAGLFGLGILGVGFISRMTVAVIVAGLAGLAFGGLDVSMNDRASDLERRAGRPLMSSFHAMFSGGTLFAALTYAALARSGVGNGIILALCGILVTMIAAAALVSTTSVRGERQHGPTARSGSRTGAARTGALTLGALAFIVFLVEGAMMDWVAIYMVRVLGTSESIGATGYAIVAAMMLLGRLLGDRANAILGAARLFRICVVAVALSMLAFLLLGSVGLAFAALACCGLAMANVIPIIFSAAGVLGVADGGRSLSRVLTMGYAGILLGPALIGFIAEAFSLTVSLSLVLLGLVVAAFHGKAVAGGAASPNARARPNG